jgi:hypothetical protein
MAVLSEWSASILRILGVVVRFVSLLLSLLIAFQMTCYSIASAQVSFSGNAMSGQAPVNKVGALLLTEGLAIMSANAIEITGKGQNGPKQTQLKGKIFKTTQTANGVKGHVFFDQGPGLASLDAANCDEYVKMTDGTKVSGPISDVADNAITCARRSIPMNEVAEVHSARVFKLSSSLGDKPHMNLDSTCVKGVATTKVHPKSTSSGGDFPLGKVLLAATIVGVVTCAIVLPIVIPQAVKHHHHHQLNTRGQNNVVYNKLNKILHPSSSSSSSSNSSSGP